MTPWITVMRALGHRAGWGCVLALLWLTRPLGAQTLPPNFIEDIVASNLDFPIAFAALPDGRLLIAQKGGVVRAGEERCSAAGAVHRREREGQRLLGSRHCSASLPIRSFATNNFVYLYYVFEHNASDYSGPKTARLTRVTASGDTANPSSEVTLLGTLSGPSCGGFPTGSDCIPADSPSHNGGTIRFASDNTMYLTTGDGASFSVVDDLALRAKP